MLSADTMEKGQNHYCIILLRESRFPSQFVQKTLGMSDDQDCKVQLFHFKTSYLLSWHYLTQICIPLGLCSKEKVCASNLQ